jgi:hypothetical protein
MKHLFPTYEHLSGLFEEESEKAVKQLHGWKSKETIIRFDDATTRAMNDIADELED